VSNFGEWAFGGDPAAADAFIASLKGTLVGPGNDFQFEFQRLINAASLGLQYRYFISEDLNAWSETTPILISAAQNEDDAAYEIVAMQLSPSEVAGKNKLYVRVLAEPAN
jgi:hypothetical protein